MKPISDLDKFLSTELQQISNPILELLLLPFALIFNRFYNLIPGFTILIISSIYASTILETYGHEPLSSNATNLTKFKIGLFFSIILTLAEIFCTICIVILKNAIKRERPRRQPFYIYNVAESETGTFAMPSGDSGAAAVFTIFVGYSMQIPYLCLLIPVVMIARVYN